MPMNVETPMPAFAAAACLVAPISNRSQMRLTVSVVSDVGLPPMRYTLATVLYGNRPAVGQSPCVSRFSIRVFFGP